MMPCAHWIMCCQNAIVDRQSNNISLINVVEQLNLPAQALTQSLVGVPLQAVVLWEGETAETESFAQRVVWRTPGGTEHVLHTGEQVTVAAGERHRSILNFAGVIPPLEEFGIHFLAAKIQENGGDWREITRVAIQIAPAPAAPPTPDSTSD